MRTRYVMGDYLDVIIALSVHKMDVSFAPVVRDLLIATTNVHTRWYQDFRSQHATRPLRMCVLVLFTASQYLQLWF